MYRFCEADPARSSSAYTNAYHGNGLEGPVMWPQKKHSSHSRSVSFSKIEIRTHALILGDSPSVASGAPLTLAWEYTSFLSTSVEKFERYRRERRRGDALLFTPSDRHEILYRAGYSDFEIHEAAQVVENSRKKNGGVKASLARIIKFATLSSRKPANVLRKLWNARRYQCRWRSTRDNRKKGYIEGGSDGIFAIL